MRTPCTFRKDYDGCQGTGVMRCNYCGTHQGNACGKEGADRSMVTALAYGNLSAELVPLAQQLKEAGVLPYSAPKHVVERMAEYTEKHLSEPAALPGFQRPPFNAKLARVISNRRGPDTNVVGDVCVTRPVDKAPGIRPACNCGRNPQGPGAADPAAHNNFCAYARDAAGVTIQVDDTTLAQVAAGTYIYSGRWQAIFRVKSTADGRILDYCRESYPLTMPLTDVVKEVKCGLSKVPLHGVIIEIF